METYDDQDPATQQHIMDLIAHQLVQQQFNPRLIPQQQQQQQLLQQPLQQQPPHRQLEALTLHTTRAAAAAAAVAPLPPPQQNWIDPIDAINPAAPVATCLNTGEDDVDLGAVEVEVVSTSMEGKV